MRCQYCGAELPQDAAFCQTCGNPVNTQNSLDPAAACPVYAANTDPVDAFAPPPKKRRKGLWAVIVVLLIVAVLAVGFFTIHFGTEGTCVEASECILCGKILEDAPGHRWDDATCSAPKTCSVCGTTRGDPAEHQWQAATCSAPATCTLCGETEGEALEHQWNPSTCTVPPTCSVCGFTDETADGHVWEDASCYEPQTCRICGATQGDPAGHEWNAATCTEPETCVSCGAEGAGAKGHSWAAATESEPKTCRVCGETEGRALSVNAVYLNEMAYYDKYGKLWTRSESPVDYPTHPNADDLNVWKEYDIPGHTVGKVYDCWGNRYKYGLHVDGYESAAYYVSYDLDGKYTMFTAWCAFPGDPLSQNSQRSEKYIEIRADGVLVYVTDTMGKDCPREYIELDVTGVHILEIRYPATVNNNEAATLYDASVS